MICDESEMPSVQILVELPNTKHDRESFFFDLGIVFVRLETEFVMQRQWVIPNHHGRHERQQLLFHKLRHPLLG